MALMAKGKGSCFSSLLNLYNGLVLVLYWLNKLHLRTSKATWFSVCRFFKQCRKKSQENWSL